MGGRGGGSSIASRAATPSAVPAPVPAPAAPVARPSGPLDDQILANGISQFFGEDQYQNLATIENVKLAFPNASSDEVNAALKRLFRAGRINLIEDPNPKGAPLSQLAAGFRLGGDLVTLFVRM